MNNLPQQSDGSVQATTPVVPVAPVAPVGTAHKESLVTNNDQLSTHEFMQSTEVAPSISQEVKEAGVEVVTDTPELTLTDQNAGISLAKESVVHPTAPTGAVHTPLTQEEAVSVIKTKNFRSSWFWRALSFLREMHKKALTG